MIETAEKEGANAEASSAKEATSETKESETAVPRRAMQMRSKELSRGVAFGSKSFVVAAIRESRNTKEVLTFARAFCVGVKQTHLFCAGRGSPA